jgi:hypothetical protein
MPIPAYLTLAILALFKACIQCLIYHKSFLLEKLHRKSSVRNSLFMTEEIPHSSFVTVKYPWNSSDDTPEISGLPPDILMLSEFESVRQELNELKTSITSAVAKTVGEELDKRYVGGSELEMMRKVRG